MTELLNSWWQLGNMDWRIRDIHVCLFGCPGITKFFFFQYPVSALIARGMYYAPVSQLQSSFIISFSNQAETIASVVLYAIFDVRLVRLKLNKHNVGI